ncbi:MAG: nicotinate phosphoribosyltransferase [Bacteroidota bacterium]
MPLIDSSSGLYTDHYELTMAQGYFLGGKKDTRANFDYFFRKNPYDGGFVVFAGLDTMLETISHYHFGEEDCSYLKSMGFDSKFIEYLKAFRFSGNIYSPREGEIVFANEPLLRVEGNIIETQLVETLILNILNFQSLIATKAARMRLMAGDRLLIDFGLRRAQGLGAIHASRAAMIGGFNGSSNAFSASRFGFESTGTMAHSWIQTFEKEIDAFREYARLYPDSTILLVDTYDTLKHGVPNAITVAKEMEKDDHRLTGIRLDSGDLAYMSKNARKMLNEAGLDYVKIVVSNQLDEYLIKSLLDQDAPVDSFGVGTSLVTGMGEGALDGVYKLTHVDDRPSMKVSENIAKTTLPGLKKIYRYVNGQNLFYADGIELADEKIPKIIHHPYQAEKSCSVDGYPCKEITGKVMEGGKVLVAGSLGEAAEYAGERLAQVPAETKRFDNPHIYKVGIGQKVMDLRNKLKDTIWKR